MIRLLIGTGPTRENTTANTWIPNAMAANRHAVPVKCAKGNNSKRVKSVDPAIQNGMTRPNSRAHAERNKYVRFQRQSVQRRVGKSGNIQFATAHQSQHHQRDYVQCHNPPLLVDFDAVDKAHVGTYSKP